MKFGCLFILNELLVRGESSLLVGRGNVFYEPTWSCFRPWQVSAVSHHVHLSAEAELSDFMINSNQNDRKVPATLSGQRGGRGRSLSVRCAGRPAPLPSSLLRRVFFFS